jgi:ribosome-binding protein aMBF1 (putative translation factor)
MNGEILHRARLAAGVSYPRLAAAMGAAVSRIPAIERAEHVTDPVAARYIAALCAVSQAQGARGALERLSKAVLEEPVTAGAT